jgi:hypothetical protein
VQRQGDLPQPRKSSCKLAAILQCSLGSENWHQRQFPILKGTPAALCTARGAVHNVAVNPGARDPRKPYSVGNRIPGKRSLEYVSAVAVLGAARPGTSLSREGARGASGEAYDGRRWPVNAGQPCPPRLRTWGTVDHAARSTVPTHDSLWVR